MSTIAVDPAFRVIPQNSTFFSVWRIEKLQVVSVPKENYGQFYDGDSYIVICASDGKDRADSQLIPREVKNGVGLDIHIHFWLGSKTSQDEAGVAAYKSVELDDYLGGSPVQHRETQGHESQRFLSYYRNGMRVLKGGVESGFNKIDISLKPHLYQVKGKRAPVVRELSEINWDQLNDGDVFILDACRYIYVWTGQYANNMEKIQAIRVAQQIKGENAPECEAVIIVEDTNESELSGSEREYFEKYLPFADRHVLSHTDVPKDTTIEMNQRQQIVLYHCTDEDNNLKVSKVKTGPLDQSDLNPNDSFIIDNNVAGLWVWVGKGASAKEKTEAMRNAQGFIMKKSYPQHTRVTRVIDGGEPIEFKNLFRSWKDLDESIGLGKAYSFGKVAKITQKKFDPTVLHENHVLAAETQMVDDGSGHKEVYRVKNFDVVDVATDDHGKFYAGDCYLVIYTYGANQTIIYYWLGSKSTVDERGTAAMKAVDFDNNKFNGSAVQVRVVEGKEPPHFMAIFSGKMILYKGGFDSGFHNRQSGSSDETKSSTLLQVRGTTSYNTKAIEVDPLASSLNSNDVFVLITPETTYVWAGKGSLGDEREMAKQVADDQGNGMSLVSEGQEKDDFWEALGGRAEYSNDKRLQVANDPHTPRLFQCSNANGQFTIEEVPHFDQSDLIEDDVMLLDAWDALFLWIGNHSNRDERKQSLEAVQQYLITDPSDRDRDTPVIVLKQGCEPANFTGFFGVWDHSIWKRSKSFSEIKDDLKSSNKLSGSVSKPIDVNGVNNNNNNNINNNININNNNINCYSTDFDSVNKYPIEKLSLKETILLPEDVDPTKKEIYLTADDFKQVFGITHKEFQSIPKWKQLDLKKKVGLF